MKYDTEAFGDRHEFKSTSWGLVLSAWDAAAMDSLIRIYWKPLYFFVRQRGYDNETAKDIVQEFLATFLERKAIRKADPARGKFRTFLLTALKNFIADWTKASKREKRGGHAVIQSLNFTEGEKEYAFQVSAGEPPERLVDRAWAREVFDQCLAELRGSRAHIEALKLRLKGEDYKAVAERTGLSEEAAQVAVHRLSKKFGEVLRRRLRPFNPDAGDFEAELTEFMSLILR